MKMFQSLAISGSGMTAQRMWLDLISNNIANVNTTRTREGGPYQRQAPVFAQRLEQVLQGGYQGAGVQVSRITRDQSPPRLQHEPEHPDADANGFVSYPNVELNKEFVNMITASRAYEANAAAFESAKQMALRALEIGR
ncbi:MAG: flagellar basal body rod protein FlgC [Eubacteriales bacterium]|jgi:flagellar basal-body rod protein FlgC|nr:flagellar basal body rod protein FlgC [Bacillota bacterium]MBV1727723.1 flagellar basal body rod protein FlgC [Desulforudis sp.]MDZ4042039.1 flagellar basal body rod protein FlgC [Eubacteriales bacterium]MBU4532785.1 flagellar basal body rod protein FlgC [Bacillota bacterium]MBU4553675.1 flagellar basal body rod protein FlgC [Bacillota bacterium]